MKKVEVLSPVGSMESLIAAVRAGADAVYLGAKSFSARRNATNFDEAELKETVAYCHIRNVKVYVTVNIMIKESEISQVMELIEYLNQINVDGLIIQDLGLARLVSQTYPELPIHGSTQMSISSPAALALLKEMGFSRVVVARENSKQQLIEICQKAQQLDMEIEYFVHGALCMSVSGQCLLSAMIGSRSGNRGLCAQACRLPFKVPQGTGYDLSLKDSSLFAYAEQLQQIGVASLKIEGRMKRAEYVAMATNCCRNAVDGKTYDDSLLKKVFSRSGFTDGYYQHQLGKNMFGIRTKEDVDASLESFRQIHELYRFERPNVGVNMTFTAKKDQEITLLIRDDSNEIEVKGPLPLVSENKATTQQEIIASLDKLGNTPFYLIQAKVDLENGLFIRNSIVKNLRREAIERLQKERSRFIVRKTNPREKRLNKTTHHLKKFYIRIASLQQLPNDLSAIAGVIVPIDADVQPVPVEMIVEIDRFILNEAYVTKRLQYFQTKGCHKAYCNTLAGLSLAKQAGFEIMYGNFGNVANSYSCQQLHAFGVKQIISSVELNVDEIEQIETEVEKGVIGYGRIPLMLLVNCPLKNGRDCQNCDKKGYIVDRKGIQFPIRCHLSVSELLNSTPIYLADKMSDFQNVDFMLLYFTIESQNEVNQMITAYLEETKILKDYTRGLYYRSVL